MSDQDGLTVLQSLGPQTDSDVLNPYTELFLQAIGERVQVRRFAWRAALTREFDLFHVHWPEHLIRGTGAKRIIKPALFGLLLARLRLRKIPIVRTVHNVRPHETGDGIERTLLEWLDQMTSAWIVMNGATETPHRERTVYIPHGHYRDWYPTADIPPKSGRLAYFGGIRDYKGVDQLINAFSQSNSDLTLSISGKVSDPVVQRELEGLAKGDDSIELDLRFLSDQELVAQISMSEIVVLPYRNLHNSGSALLALSMNRPILVPSTPSTEELRTEFGPQWVATFTGDLTGPVLDEKVTSLRGQLRDEVVDMSEREWPAIASRTLFAYEIARSSTHGHEHASSDSPTADHNRSDSVSDSPTH